MTIDVFICTKNRSNIVLETISSVIDAASTVNGVSINVCDNGSNDNTLEMLRHYKHPLLRVYSNENRGKSLCLNKMIQATNGNFLLFTDDDVVVPPNWINDMTSRAMLMQADAIVGGVRVANECIPETWTERHLAYYASTSHVPIKSDHPFIGANYMISRNAFDLVGGFNPLVGPGAIGHAEDTLFWLQCRQLNMKIVQARDIQVMHYPELSRMTDQGIISLAKKQGEFEAYVDYHWERYERSNLERSHLVRFLKMYFSSLVYKFNVSKPDSILSHAVAIRNFYSIVWYRKYRKLPRHYRVSHGTHHDFVYDQVIL